jgi:sensor histidine kinase YesM
MKWFPNHIDKQRILLHTGFWLAWVISFTLLQSLGLGREVFFLWFRYYVVTLPVFVIHTYLIAYWLIPLTFYKNRYGLLALGIIVLMILFSAIELIVSNEYVFRPFGRESAFSADYLNLKNILISGIGNHYIILVFLAIKVGKAWHQAQNMKKAEQRLNEEAELEIYHYQHQPRLMLHLMDILRDTISKSPQKAPELIIRISNFINQFLKENHSDWRPLLIETDLMERFLNINKVALNNQLKGEIKLKGNLRPFVIPPFLFLPVLEFAIKTGKMCNDLFECTVFIRGENRKLYFTVELWSENRLELPGYNDSEMLRLRLQHYFPEKFRLTEENNENFRKLQLEISY